MQNKVCFGSWENRKYARVLKFQIREGKSVMIANLNLVHAPTVKFQTICILDHIHQHQYLRRKSYTFPSANKLFGCSLLISHYYWLFFSCFNMQWARLQWATYSSSYSFVTSYTEFEPVKIRSMAALCEGVTWLGQLIFQFLTCVIFRTEKDKVFERQRQISVADEQTFSTFAAIRSATNNQRLFVNAVQAKAEVRMFKSRKSQGQETEKGV